jgi:hypothetical protein
LVPISVHIFTSVICLCSYIFCICANLNKNTVGRFNKYSFPFFNGQRKKPLAQKSEQNQKFLKAMDFAARLFESNFNHQQLTQLF